jgi:hypothetical protein
VAAVRALVEKKAMRESNKPWEIPWRGICDICDTPLGYQPESSVHLWSL